MINSIIMSFIKKWYITVITKLSKVFDTIKKKKS